MVAATKNELWIADPADVAYPFEPTTRLIDLNLLECELPSSLLGGFWMIDAPRFARPFRAEDVGTIGYDGDFRTGYGYGDAVLAMRIGLKNLATEDALAAARDLATALHRKGVLAFQLKGTEDVEYFDYRASPLGELIDGRTGGIYQLVKWLTHAEGMELNLAAYPWPRLAPVDGLVDADGVRLESVTIDNSATGRHFTIDNPGNKPAEVIVTVTPDSGLLAGTGYAIRDHGNLTEFGTIYGKASADASVLNSDDAPAKYHDTTVEAVTDATGGQAQVIDFATWESMARRFRDPRTVVDATALAGVYKVKGRIAQLEVADRSKFRVRLLHGFTNDDYLQEAGPRIDLDFRDVDTENFSLIDLGYVVVPEGATKVVLDLWAARLDGDSKLAVDQLELLPADFLNVHAVSVPGHRMGKQSRTVFDADELTGTGRLRKGAYQLNENGEIARTTPAAGFQLTAGVHCVELDYALREPDDPALTDDPNPTEKEIGKLRVIEDPTGAATVVKSIVLRCRKNAQWTRRTRKLFFNVTPGDEAANKEYRFEVEFTAATESGRRIDVNEMEHSFVAAITEDRPLVIDSWLRYAYAADAGAPGFSVNHENEFPLAPPGRSTWVMPQITLPTDPGYDDLDDREPVGRDELTQSAAVAVTLIPRRSH